MTTDPGLMKQPLLTCDAPRPAARRALLIAMGLPLLLLPAAAPAAAAETLPPLPLPAPDRQGSSATLEHTLQQRRSVRRFAADAPALTPAQLGQLLWAAQGISSTGSSGSNDTEARRTAPSAGALYPLELRVIVGAVQGLSPGIYRYLPQPHALQKQQRQHQQQAHSEAELRARVAAAARGQGWLQQAAALIVVSAVPQRTAQRYGAQTDRYVAMEAGAAVQNLLLQATALKLGATFVGAFDAEALHTLLGLPAQEQALVIVPVGWPG